MCKFQKPEESNHHFPELNRNRKWFKFLMSLFNQKRLTALSLVFMVALGFVYLTQVNVAATEGYQIKELEVKLKNLEEQNKKLNLEHIELQSMANIINRVPELNLVAVDDVEVIRPSGSAVALK